MIQSRCSVGTAALLLAVAFSVRGTQAEPFEHVASKLTGPMVKPWRVFDPDPAYHGQWLVAGDVDGDGQAEIVTARHDKQKVTTVLVSKLDGSPLWRWGKPNTGGQGLWCDVAVQIYDHDGDGRNEVWISVQGHLVVLEGKTGKEIRRLPLPKDLPVADCIVFCNLAGAARARDILVKDRYRQVWAYGAEWKPLWHWKPEGYMTCHHPTPVDLDGDGRDEIVAGYTVLDEGGKELWTVKSTKTELKRGHLDCCNVMALGKRPQDCRLVLTYCGANGIAMVDGTGRVLWEVAGHHFESAQSGKLRRDLPGKQILVDIDHRPFGQGPVCVMDDKGNRLGTWITGYGRHHRLIDWDGDGLDEVLVANERRVFDAKTGQCVAFLGPEEVFAGEVKPTKGNDPGPLGVVGDVDGDGRPEIILHSPKRIAVYKSDRATKVAGAPLGTGVNFTLY